MTQDWLLEGEEEEDDEGGLRTDPLGSCPPVLCIRLLEQGRPGCCLLWGPELAADPEMGLHKAQCCPEAPPGPGIFPLSSFEERGDPPGKKDGLCLSSTKLLAPGSFPCLTVCSGK